MHIINCEHRLSTSDNGFLYQPQVFEASMVPSGYKMPFYFSNEEAIEHLVKHKLDGRVQRFTFPAEGHTPCITAGISAYVYIDTSATDGDKQTPTRESLEEKGYRVSGTYEGPFPLSRAKQILEEFRECEYPDGTLMFDEVRLVKQGNGYNVVIVDHPTYEYHINLNERGEFYADVRTAGGKRTVFEVKGAELFEDGFMSNPEDVSGLQDYLQSMGVLEPNASLQMSH